MNPYSNEIAQKLYEAFVEGWGSYASPCSPYNSPDEAWEESYAKEVADKYENS